MAGRRTPDDLPDAHHGRVVCRIRRHRCPTRYAPVRDYHQVVADPGAWENGYFAETQDADGNVRRIVGVPIRMSETPLEPGAEAPELGEHSAEILREAGYADEEIAAFREAGVV